eukprot:CAMPEP_0113591452 /NCGR_PEP_ID=MMETSP0015_2-20120614/37279_1 /TAXON_ID=2838 /ORGANISM="Odontella" /LENGTH=595 /DNA_ID=CAMNT_0000497839 /DNA_START=149 /DNA_END=1936 /DNA_ORIENTATION=+ /assembly_acc=CAM_ASM_000160
MSFSARLYSKVRPLASTASAATATASAPSLSAVSIDNWASATRSNFYAAQLKRNDALRRRSFSFVGSSSRPTFGGGGRASASSLLISEQLATPDLAARVAPLHLQQHRNYSAAPEVINDENVEAAKSGEVPSVVRPAFPPKHYVPRSERSETNTVFEFDPLYKDRLVKTSRACPTRELNYGPKQWLRHKDPWRRVRHIGSLFNSSPFRRLALPDLAVTASVGAALSYYNVFVSPDIPLGMDGSAMAGATTAIGLLAAFRLNASYGRWDEARKFWGEINNSTRDLAGNAVMWLDSDKRKTRMLKVAKAFPFGMLFHLNESGAHLRLSRKDPRYHERKYSEFYAEMNDIFQDETDPDFVQICNTFYHGGHVPLCVSAIMRSIIAVNDTDPIYNREMDEQVQRLVGQLGMCERLLRTPIPTCFTRHTSRLFFFWSNLLPFAMYSSLGPLGTIPGSLLVSYAVLGIEDIGVQLEEPFNILPLRQYSDVMFDAVNSIEGSYLETNRRMAAAVLEAQAQVQRKEAEQEEAQAAKVALKVVEEEPVKESLKQVNGTNGARVNGTNGARNGKVRNGQNGYAKKRTEIGNDALFGQMAMLGNQR